MRKRTHPSEMFKVLGVESRINIIELLKSRGPLGVKTIAKELNITPSAVSQHLRILSHAGFVTKERQGYWIPYSVDEKALESCGGMLMDVCHCGCREPSHAQKAPTKGDDLASLIKYKESLEKELKQTLKKISQLKKDKK
jgi:DNA-binding transcriptional ArsR family regulator